jgi:hypothetical protein
MQTPDRKCERRWKGDDGEWYPRFQMRSTIYGALIMYDPIRANTSKLEIAERYGSFKDHKNHSRQNCIRGGLMVPQVSTTYQLRVSAPPSYNS